MVSFVTVSNFSRWQITTAEVVMDYRPPLSDTKTPTKYPSPSSKAKLMIF